MNRSSIVWGWSVAVALMVSMVGTTRGDVIKQTPGTDFLIVEAEAFEFLEGPEDTTFVVVGAGEPLEASQGSSILPPDTNASGGLALYDQVGGGFFDGSATWQLQFATP